MDARLHALSSRLAVAKPAKGDPTRHGPLPPPQRAWVACVVAVAETVVPHADRQQFLSASGITLHHLDAYPEVAAIMWSVNR